MVFRCPNIQAHYHEVVVYLIFGTPKNNEFSIWNKWKIYYFQVSQYLSTLAYIVYILVIYTTLCRIHVAVELMLWTRIEVVSLTGLTRGSEFSRAD